jgi:ribosome-binding protein aMBF1 (putative translation factor)
LDGAVEFRDLLREDLKKPGFRKDFEAYYLELRVAEKLHALREERRMTQKELAARLKMNQNAVSRLEACEHSMTLRTLQRVAAALGYEIDIRFKPASLRRL